MSTELPIEQRDQDHDYQLGIEALAMSHALSLCNASDDYDEDELTITTDQQRRIADILGYALDDHNIQSITILPMRAIVITDGLVEGKYAQTRHDHVWISDADV